MKICRISLLILAGILAVGCIRSRAYITSQPSGAEVYFQGKRRGPTPIYIPFIWYWHYDIKLEKEGYETLDVRERFRTPPWFVMPFDFIAEAIPYPFYDTRHRHYELDKTQEP